MSQPLIVSPGSEVRLSDFNPKDTGKINNKEEAAEELETNIAKLAELGYRLYAENKRALLLVLQGMDTSGKDGTIRNVMKGFNPQSCQVTSFKEPSLEEKEHDFLWRISLALPRKGNIGIFNRSHYEDVLIARVHKIVDKHDLKARYEQINTFEKLLMAGGTTIIKVFLHISKEEQRRRLQARLDDATKRWKFSRSDIAERKLWDEYQRAYEIALTKCNTKGVPWYIVPADHKWYRNLMVSRILRSTLEDMNPRYPHPQPGLDKIKID